MKSNIGNDDGEHPTPTDPSFSPQDLSSSQHARGVDMPSSEALESRKWELLNEDFVNPE